MRECQFEAIDQWESGITDIIKEYVKIKGRFDHSNIKQMIAMARWGNAWNEYQIKKSKIIKEWVSDDNKTWQCRCGATNVTKDTNRLTDSRGIVLRCSNWLHTVSYHASQQRYADECDGVAK